MCIRDRDSQKRLSARNERALSECIRRGIEIVPCTGRIWSGVPAFIREFPGIHYAITTNGAVVENVVDHMVIKETKLSCEKAVQLLELGRQFHTMYDVCLLYTSSIRFRSPFFHGASGMISNGSP